MAPNFWYARSFGRPTGSSRPSPRWRRARLKLGSVTENAIGLAHGYITGDPSLLYRSALKVGIYPELTDSYSLFTTSDVRLGVRPVSTISEAMGLLEHLDDVRRQPGLMRSIKRAIGASAD